MEGSSSSCGVECDEELKVLGKLLDLFGSEFSHKEIASAFCEAGRDGNLAADILCKSQECGSRPGSEVLVNGGSEVSGVSEVVVEKRSSGNRGGVGSKAKRVSVSLGTVSSVLGKDYCKPTVLENGKCETTKPLKLNSNEIPVSEIWGDDKSLDLEPSKERMHHEMADFLQKMLGNGYRLGIDVIREVLCCCGYDMEKSMEQLLDISASRTLNKCDDIISSSVINSVGNISRPESQLNTENLQNMDISTRNETESQDHDKERYDLPKQVLASLFSVSKRFEESPPKSRPVRQKKKIIRTKHGVVAPPGRYPTADNSAEIVERQVEQEEKEDANKDEEEEDSYHVLRRAAKAHWNTMKEYYKSATDAYAEGDLSLACKLLEQGQLYNDKAREADKKSAQLILEESKDKENRDQVTLNLHDNDTKEALKLVKCHLTNLSGIPGFSYLKITVKTEGIQKQRVLKLLEKESVNWTEAENGGAIVIRIDEIDPKKLSFAKNAR